MKSYASTDGFPRPHLSFAPSKSNITHLSVLGTASVDRSLSQILQASLVHPPSSRSKSDSVFEMNQLQYSGLENFHGQRSLAGYCPWGRKGHDGATNTFTQPVFRLQVLLKSTQLYESSHLTKAQNGIHL